MLVAAMVCLLEELVVSVTAERLARNEELMWALKVVYALAAKKVA